MHLRSLFIALAYPLTSAIESAVSSSIGVAVLRAAAPSRSDPPTTYDIDGQVGGYFESLRVKYLLLINSPKFKICTHWAPADTGVCDDGFV